jgi:hypothetical protein
LNTVEITQDTRKNDGWVKGKTSDAIVFSAKVYDIGSNFGIDNGRVSKLDIRRNGRIIANYDRGWDVSPSKSADVAAYNSVIAALEQLEKTKAIAEPEKKGSLLAELEEAKAEVGHNHTFNVTITETLSMTVEIKAGSRLEAEEIVEANWNNSEYILDASNFVGAEFEAELAKPERSKGVNTNGSR